MRKNLKILYHHRIAAQDGQSVHIHELTKAFKELGHELIFIGPSLRPAKFGEDNKLLAFVRKFLPNFMQELLELAYGIRAYSKLKKAYDTHKPDVLYERHNLFLPAGRWLKKKTGIPYLLEVNAPLSEERGKYSKLKFKKFAQTEEVRTWRSADMNFPVSGVLAGKMRKQNVDAKNITVLHNGINYSDYNNLNTSKIREQFNLSGKTVLGFTGFLREWHKLERVISLISHFEEVDSPHLLVVGEGPAIESCQNLAIELGIQHRIHFTGFVSREEIPTYLAAMDIALQPAVTSYASPLKIFEYMVSGLAILAPNQPNIREMLTNNKDALLFDENDFSAAEDLILSLVTDKKLRDLLGKAAIQTVSDRQYIWRSNAERITDIAQDLLEKKST